MSQRDDPLIALCATPIQCVGTVAAVAPEDGACRVDTPQGAVVARRAVSCLVGPAAGDRVWLSGDLTHGLYVTAVLERSQAAAPLCVSLPAGSSIEVAQGSLTLRATSLLIASKQLAVQADDAALCAGKLTGVGREATWSFGRIKVISELFESFAERVVQFSRWSQRTVDGPDQVRSRQIDYRAEQSMQLQAQNLIANADNLVKFDGEQIHLG